MLPFRGKRRSGSDGDMRGGAALNEAVNPRLGFVGYLTREQHERLQRLLALTQDVWRHDDDDAPDDDDADSSDTDEFYDARGDDAHSVPDTTTPLSSASPSECSASGDCHSRSVRRSPTQRRTAAIAGATLADALIAQGRHSPVARQAILLQYLRARDFHVQRAHEQLRACLRWRRQQRPIRRRFELMHADRDARATFPFRIVDGCRNKFGHLLVYGRMSLFRAREVEREAFRVAVVALMERVCFYRDLYPAPPPPTAPPQPAAAAAAGRHPHGDERVTVVFDLSGEFSVRKNANLACYIDMIQLVQDRYPERLGQLYIVWYPPWISYFYKL